MQFVKTFGGGEKKNSFSKQKRHLASRKHFSRLAFQSQGVLMLKQRAQESGGFATCRRNGAVTRTCGARPAWEPSTYVVLLFILTYMLAIMSRTSFPQSYSLLAIYVSTALPWRTPLRLPTPCHLHSLRWMFCPPFAFCSALMSQGHM